MFGLGQGALYKQVYADDTLTEAWRKVRMGTDLAGVDGITVAQFQARLFANLKALQSDLRRCRYAPQPVKRLASAKPDGSKRPLGILTVRDRIVQRAVLTVIEPIFDADFEECSHGFRKGRSIQTALMQVSRLINLGYGWVVDFDITSCFEMINTKRLIKFINNRLKNDEIRYLIQVWIDVEAAAVERLGVQRKRETRGVLQGGILSPLFANVYLDRFDKAALKQGLKLVRYADDGLVCCHSQQDAKAALKTVERLLAKLDLAINPHKTVIQHVDRGFDYLGQRFFIKHQGPDHEALVVRPRKLTPHPVRVPPNRRLRPARVAHADPKEEDVWELST